MFGRLLDFLFSLRDVHFGDGARPSFVYHYPALIVLGVLVLLALGYLSYLPQAASPGKKRAMGLLRGLLLALVLVLAFRPQLVMEREERLRSVVAVWLDNSRSMSLDDPYTGPGTPAEMRAYLQDMTEKVRASAGGTVPAGAPRLNRYELATAALAHTRWLRDLAESQDIIFFTGAGRAQVVGIAVRPQQVDECVARLKAARAEVDITDVPTVIRDILDHVQGQRVSALVLLTDGQTTQRGARPDLAAGMAQSAGSVIHAVPLGQEDPPFDLEITGFRVPQATFARDPAAARIAVAASGITGPTPVKISVYHRGPAGQSDLGTPLVTREVTLDPNELKHEVEIPIRLQKHDPGASQLFELEARIEAVAAGLEERTLENNAKVRPVTVMDAQMNVLYVEGYPRWEYRYITSELIREPTVNISTLLVSADEGFTQDADPRVVDRITGEEKFPGALQHFPDTLQDLSKYDVLLLGDVEPSYFSPTQQNLIVEWVRTKGGGLCWIAGNAYNPELFRATALEVLLPVTPDEIDARARIVAPADNAPYNLMLTPAGRETNLFRFFDDSELSWKEVANLPPLYWFKPVQGLKPGAIVLAMHPTRSQGGNPAPLLVMRQFGAGPVLFSAYGDSWRWRRYTGEPLFQSYWLQLCRLLYSNKALGQSRRLELMVESTQVEIGGQIKVSLVVKDPTLSSQMPLDIPLLVTDPQGRTAESLTLSRPFGRGIPPPNDPALDKLEGATSLNRVGTYTLAIRPGMLPVEVQPVEIHVQTPQREFEEITADLQSLRSLTTRTSGEIVPLYRAEELVRKIPDRSMPVLHTQSEELWNKPIALILVLLLATAEWLVRKSAGLI